MQVLGHVCCECCKMMCDWMLSVKCRIRCELFGFVLFECWANPRGNAIRGRPVDGVEQAHSTRPWKKNTGNFIGLSLETVAEITLQRTDTTHDLSSESREAITITNTY